jgi:hypothetical protein
MGCTWRGRIARELVSASLTVVVLAGCQDAAAPRPAIPAPTADEVAVDDPIGIQSNPWVSLPRLATTRSHLAAVRLQGCIWSLGGEDGAFTPTEVVERYCPEVDPSQWTPGPSLPEPLSRFAGVGVIAQKIYVAGGVDTTANARNSLYIYDPGTGWTLSPEPMPFALACGGGTVVGGKFYVYASRPQDDPETGSRCIPHVDQVFAVYDPAKVAPPRWTLLPPDPVTFFRCDHGVASIGTLVYLVEGTEQCEGGPSGLVLGSVAAFNTATGQWLPASSVPPVPVDGGPAGLYGVTALELSGRLFVFGGNNQALDRQFSRDVSVYEPATNTWDQLRPMLSFREHAAVAASSSTRVTVIGGQRFVGAPLDSVERLNIPAGCDVHEPDATLPLANPWRITVGPDFDPHFAITMTQARVCSAGDVDLFTISNPLQNSFNIQMTPPTGRNYQLELLDATATTVLATSALPGSATETVAMPPTGSNFVLRVKSQNGSFDKVRPYRMGLTP